MKVSLEVKLDSLKAFDEFKKEFRKGVIENGLDKPLQKAVIDLKTELKTAINNRTPNSDNLQDKADPTQPSKPNTGPAPMSKSTEDLLAYFTGADLKKHNPQTNHNVIDGSNVLSSQFSKNTDGPNRIDVRLEISPDESIEEHYSRALQIFQNSVFAIPNAQGMNDYFINSGEDLSDVTKIDCSTMTGDGDEEPKKGMSPARRFELDKKNKGYATWTLKQEFVNRVRANQTKFVNLNPIIKNIQDGNPEEAARYANRLPKNDATKNVQEKLANIVEGKQLPVPLEAYLKIIGLINNLKIQKITNPKAVTYRLISTSSGSLQPSDKRFLDELKTNISLWAISSADKWFKDLVAVAEKVIKNFAGV